MRGLLGAAIAALVSAQAPTWYGFRPEENALDSLEMIDIGDSGVVNRVIGKVPLGRGEVAWTDAVRCLPGPPAFCLLATGLESGPSPAAGNESFVYRISTADASIVWKAPCPGECAHMHVDYASGHAYTFSYEGPFGARAEIVEVLGNGQPPVQVANITAAVNGGTVRVGQTTHCSATNHMYVGVSHGGAGRDQILAVDLASGAVDAVTQLQAPLFDALWATCDGSGVVGGVSFGSSVGSAEFGTVDDAGKFVPKASVAIKPGFLPSGLLTATSPATYQDAFVAAFYPKGTRNNDTAQGLIWAVDPYGGGTDDFTTPIDYVLIGASWDRGGR